MFSNPTTKLAALLGLLAIPAAADFRIYIGAEQSLSEGGNQLAWGMQIHNNPPSCDDTNNQPSKIWNPRNDATIGGWACDGCDVSKHTLDWPIERLELPHDDKYSQDTNGPLTIYWTPETGKYELRDESGQLGTCDRWEKDDDPHLHECWIIFRQISAYHVFTCYTDLTYAGKGAN
ncbi:hypothetical protein ACJ41O_012708 [Fusarium nematophilum]